MTNETTWWATSNDNGQSPAYWKPIAPFDMSQAGPLDNSPDSDGDDGSLERRLPSYVQIYWRNDCTGLPSKKCNFPLPGTCCSFPQRALINGHSVKIPSYLPGDLIIPFTVTNCAQNIGAPILLGFTGCYKSRSVVNSVKTLSCISC